MNKWDQAAKVSMCSIGQLIQDEYCDAYNGQIVSSVSQQEIVNHISNAHADLRRTFNKLVELIALKQQKLILASAYMTPKTWAEMNESEQGFDLNLKVVVIESDPDVIEAMKGEEEYEAKNYS